MRRLFGVLVIGLVLPLTACQVNGKIFQFTTGDTFVTAADPTATKGTEGEARVSAGTAPRYTYLHFSLPTLKSAKSVKLRLFITKPSSTPFTVRRTGSFNERTLNWNNKPGVDSEIARATARRANTWLEIQLPATTAIDNASMDLALVGGPTDGYVGIDTRESRGNPAMIVVDTGNTSSTTTTRPSSTTTTRPSSTTTTRPSSTTTTRPSSTTTTVPTGVNDPELGVYKPGPTDTSQFKARFDEFGRWVGSPVERYRMNVAWDQGWNNYMYPWWLGYFDNLNISMITPLFIQGANINGVLNGSYDGYYRTLADNLISHGLGDAYLSVGHEFNTDWFPWGTEIIGDANYVAAYRRVRDIFASRPGAQFKFEWNPVAGARNPLPAYPGDQYVDLVTTDLYDVDWEFGPPGGCAANKPGDWAQQRWNKFLTRDWGLNWMANFAAQRGKPMAFPEWGLITLETECQSGGDNPTYIQNMYNWMRKNNVKYHAYHNVDNGNWDHELEFGNFPNAAALYRSLF